MFVVQKLLNCVGAAHTMGGLDSAAAYAGHSGRDAESFTGPSLFS